MRIPVILDAVEKVGNQFLLNYKEEAIPQNTDQLLKVLDEIDTTCLDSLKKDLAVEFPNIPWYIGDEFDTESQRKPQEDVEYWLCDAMDGAIQYVQHLPGWTINLVLIRNGKPYFSVIFDPLANEMYWAIENEGAYMNGSEISPSTKKDAGVMIAVFEYGHQNKTANHLNKKTSNTVLHLLENFGVVRNYGPHGLQLAQVGNGRIDLFVQEDLDTYNWLAGLLIAKEAGASLLTTDGKTWQWGSESLLVASQATAQKFLLSKAQ